jgi:peptide/nickel transport system permease protein
MRNPKRFFRHWQNILGLFIVAIYIGLALAAPILAPVDSSEKNPALINVPNAKGGLPIPPNPQAPLGTIPLTTSYHVNVYYNMIWGTRSALLYGVLVACLTALLGILIGSLSAYLGGFLNSLVMRLTDSLLAIPLVVGVVMIQQLIFSIINASGPRYQEVNGAFEIQKLPPYGEFLSKINPLLVAMVLFSWMPYARLINVLILELHEAEFVMAARALGAGSLRILFRHMIPNAITPAVVWAARDVGVLVLLQASFSFIGMGGGSEWGYLLSEGRRWVIGPGGNLMKNWWVFFPATVALVFFGVGWNLLGDGINDLLNPRLL